MTTEELIEWLRKPTYFREVKQPGDVIEQMLERMREAADKIEELSILVETIGR